MSKSLREPILSELSKGDPHVTGRALVRLALRDPEWRWVQALCLRYLRDPDAGVRGAAATALGHLARIHKQLDLEAVVAPLKRLNAEDSEAAGNAAAALDDIAHFVPGANAVLRQAT